MRERISITIKRQDMFDFNQVPGRYSAFIGAFLGLVSSIFLWTQLAFSWIFLIKAVWSLTMMGAGAFIVKLAAISAQDFYKETKTPVINIFKSIFKCKKHDRRRKTGT